MRILTTGLRLFSRAIGNLWSELCINFFPPENDVMFRFSKLLLIAACFWVVEGGLRKDAIALSSIQPPSVQPQTLAPRKLAQANTVDQLALDESSRHSGELDWYGSAVDLYERGIERYNQGAYAESAKLLEEALAIASGALGESSPEITLLINSVGKAYAGQGLYEKALLNYERALAIQESAFDENEPEIALVLNNIAELYVFQGKYEQALPLYERAIAISELAYGPEHSETVLIVNGLALLYLSQGNYLEALPLFERVAEVVEAELGPDNPELAAVLGNMGYLQMEMGDYAASQLLNERALAILESAFGDEHVQLATVVGNLAALNAKQGNYDTAREGYERAITIQESSLGETHPALALLLNNLAQLEQQVGNYEAALPLYERAIAISERAHGENHPDIAVSLDNLAGLYLIQNQYDKVPPLQERALSIRKVSLGEAHPYVAISLSNIASFNVDRSNYEVAISLYEQAITILKATYGEEHPDVASTLNSLASVYLLQGNYLEALELQERVLLMRTTLLGEAHPEIATTLSGIAQLYTLQGDNETAALMYYRALEIQREAYGENHMSVAASLSNLGQIASAQGDYESALVLYEQSLSVLTSLFGEGHLMVATVTNNIALVQTQQGDYSSALSLHQKALSIREHLYGDNHPEVAASLNNLALLRSYQGDYKTALSLYNRALEIYQKIYGETHPLAAISQSNLSVLHWSAGEVAATVAALAKANAVEETLLSDVIVSASEKRGQHYINTLQGTTDLNVSFSLENKNSSEAARLALTTVARRKGRILEVSSGISERMRSQLPPAAQSTLDELITTRTQLANLYFGGLKNRTVEQYRAEIEQLESRAESLHEILSRASAIFRAETEPVSLEKIRARLPENAALIEFVRYSPFNVEMPTDAWDDDRYAAYVLKPDGTVAVFDLGEVREIDQKTATFEKALATRGDVRAIARELDSVLMEPIRTALDDETHLIISPDSQLNLIPFDALIDEGDRYLIESFQISYLNASRDLLKFSQESTAQQPPVVIADPNYDERSENLANSVATPAQRSADASALYFKPLPGTATEADVLLALMPDASVYTQKEATETVLKQVSAPSILHIATHGFFLPDVEFVPDQSPSAPASLQDASQAQRSASLTVVSTEVPADVTESNKENPLLRSGLALAGINNRENIGEDEIFSEDGIFTALEASSLNLQGTQLVVLSACETGLGRVSVGEGVYGLRRAFVIAGAQSQLMSLWQVDDAGTSELMQVYYENLIEEKQGRSEALRNAQLEMMNTGTYAHPYYWSSFIFSGDWQPLTMDS